MKKEEMYETRISTARWWAYDIPGNLGWITYVICEALLLRRALSWVAAVGVVPAALMLLGVGELLSERAERLDRVLPRRRLMRGFGCLTLGGILGAGISMLAIMALAPEDLPVWMLLGSVLCAVFAGLCYLGYKPQEK